MTRKSFSILASFCGANRTLTLPSFLRLMEEISIEDVIKAGYPKEATLNRGLLWVISRVVVKIHKVPKYDDKVSFETFPFKKMRTFFPRGYILRDEKDNVLIEAEAIWGLIDEKSRKLIDPSDYQISIKGAKTPLDFTLSEADFIFASKEETNGISCRKVTSSQLDLNAHMSNFHYGEWWMDEFDSDPFPSLDMIIIAFYNELSLGEEIELRYSLSKNTLIGFDKRMGNKAFEIVACRKS